MTLHNWGSADPHVKITHTGVMCACDIFVSILEEAATRCLLACKVI